MNDKLSNSKKASLNTVTSMGIKVISMLSSFIMKTILIQSMGLQYTGISSVFSDLLLLFSFAELGIGSAIVFELYKPIAEKDFKKIAKLMHFYKRAYQLIGFSIFALGLLLIPFLNFIITDVPNVKENIVVIYILYLLNTCVSYFLIYQSSLLTAGQENYKISIVQGLFFIFKLIINSFVLLLLRNFIVYLIVDILLTIIQNLIIYRMSSIRFKDIKKYNSERLSQFEKKNLFNNVSALALYQISNVVLNSTDSLIISSILGTGVVAFFANYRLIVKSVDSFASQITISLTPTLGDLAVKKNNSQKEHFNILNFFIFWITLNSSLQILFLSTPFIELWLGEKFILNNSLLILLVIDYVIVNLARPVATIRNANGLFTQGKYRPLLMALLNIIFSILFVNLFGIIGVILGTLISRILTQVWFDPYIIYKHVFFENSFEYFQGYFKNILFIFFTALMVLISKNFVNSIFSIHNNLMILISNFILTIIISNIIFYVFYKNKTEFIRILDIIKSYKH
ncbi:MATE family efflux transporter [Enterococcus casseliflavus]|uniref:hypothetical protein n=1 Tax=Enterococcus casseliflavus TaxID=37734 RepID=UPI002954DD22|nr:hypothetical protein [Enterococcus casseliflavus]MDV7751298.1 hypothetical protein [Enterococcus casseliflavus]